MSSASSYLTRFGSSACVPILLKKRKKSFRILGSEKPNFVVLNSHSLSGFLVVNVRNLKKKRERSRVIGLWDSGMYRGRELSEGVRGISTVTSSADCLSLTF